VTLPLDRIAHLLFSTRQARPEGSAGFNREIIAESPGVPAEARAGLDDLADMAGFVLNKPDLPPLWAFRRLGPETWLLVRAVSLGLYRKGNHQLLAHGLVLRRHHLQWLEGNPFLLAAPEAREAGFTFEEEHPDGRRDLEPKRLDPAFAAAAARLNLEHFVALSRDLDRFELPTAFPALFERLLDREHPTAWVPPPWLDPERPDRRFLEWLLLHLHPADRAELAFHTWYAYDRPRRFDLVGVARSDAEELQRHLHGEVAVWEYGSDASPADPPLGEKVQVLRRPDAPGYLHAVLNPYLTLLAPRFDPDLLERKLEILTPDQATLCLRHELGEELTADERAEVRELYRRRESDLLHETLRLAEAWERGPEAFAERMALHRELPIEASAEDRQVALGRVREAAERWAVLALLPTAEPPARDEELRAAWAELVPAGTFPRLLSTIEDLERTELAEEILPRWMDALVPAAGPAGTSPPWADHLRFLAARRHPVLPVAAAYERALDGAPDAARLPGYRELQKVAFDLGHPAFAVRVLFQKELPRLPEAARRIRAADGALHLLEVGDGAAGLLGAAADDPVVAEGAYGRLAAIFARDSTVDPSRLAACCAALVEVRREPLPDAAVEAAADVLAGLAAEGGAAAAGVETLAPGPELADRLLAATFRAVHGRLDGRGVAAPLAEAVALLVDLRRERPGAGEAADPALLELLPALLILAPPAVAPASLRRQFRAWLEDLLDGGRFPALVERPRTWRHLLLDELLLDPPALPDVSGASPSNLVPVGDGAVDDPRRRAYYVLAWRRWEEAVEGGGASGEATRRAHLGAEVGLLRGLAAQGAAAQLRLLEATAPHRRPEEVETIFRWLPARPPDPGAADLRELR